MLFAKANLSAVNTSVVPSDLIREYRSSSNGKNVSFVPEVTTADNSLSAMFTVSYFLRLMNESFNAREETFSLGNAVYKVLSLDVDNLVPRTLKSVTSILVPVVGSLPSQIPVTVVTPEMTILASLTV